MLAPLGMVPDSQLASRSKPRKTNQYQQTKTFLLSWVACTTTDTQNAFQCANMATRGMTKLKSSNKNNLCT